MDTLTTTLQAICSLDAMEVLDYTYTLRFHNNSFLVPDINQFKYMFNQYIKCALNEQVRNPPNAWMICHDLLLHF